MPSKRSLWVFAALALATGAASAHAETITITVEKMAFSPTAIEAKVGDTIEWINKDAFVHTATVKDGWDVMLPVKKSGSIVINAVGPIEYYCRFHPNMKGRIVVTVPRN
jgi:plastocyanin